MIGQLRALVRFTIFMLLCVFVTPPQLLILAITRGKGRAPYFLPRLWHSLVCLNFGIKRIVEGAPEKKAQTLYLSNHISYLDIPLLGSVLPCSFLAKKEVAGWALFGFLSKLQRTAFIDRKRSAIGREAGSLDSRLHEGENLIIFPEGTSTDGRDVLPFKSSLFALALGEHKAQLNLQPVTITLLSVNGHTPDNQDIRNLYAWPREMDMDLHVHLWRFAQQKGAVLKITFHPAVPALQYEDRKVLAHYCHETVRSALGAPLPAILAA